MYQVGQHNPGEKQIPYPEVHESQIAKSHHLGMKADTANSETEATKRNDVIVMPVTMLLAPSIELSQNPIHSKSRPSHIDIARGGKRSGWVKIGSG